MHTWGSSCFGNTYGKFTIRIIFDLFLEFVVFRQQKLEEALLFTGMFQDALQSLFDWLEAAEPSLSSETDIMGDTQTVSILVDNHKVCARAVV